MSEPIRTPGVTAVGVDRIQTPVTRPDDELDVSLRPRRLDEFVGQEALKSQLEVAIRAAGNRGDALDHVCWPARPASARPRWRRSWRPSSRSTSSRPPGPRSSARPTSPPS
jgi:hypothetical protein